MVNRNRAVGNGFAGDVADFLGEEIPWVERRTDGGSRDRGDIAGLDADGWCLECKRTKAIDISGALNEAEVEAKHAGASWFAAVMYRRMKGVKGAYVVMPLWIFREVLVELRRLRARAGLHG